MTNSQSSRRVGIVTIVLASLVFAGCGSDEEPPAVCSSVDALKASVETVTTVELGQGVLVELRGNLEKVRSDLRTVRDDAGDEYSAEIDSVDQAVEAVGTSVRAAVSSPSSEAITAIGADIDQLGTSAVVLEGGRRLDVLILHLTPGPDPPAL